MKAVGKDEGQKRGGSWRGRQRLSAPGKGESVSRAPVWVGVCFRETLTVYYRLWGQGVHVVVACSRHNEGGGG